MKRKTNLSRKFPAWAENSRFLSTLSCALTPPITSWSSTAACQTSSFANTGNQDSPFSTIHQPVQSPPDEAQLTEAADS